MPNEFERAAQASLARLCPQDRLLFGHYLQGQAQWHGVRIAGLQEQAGEQCIQDVNSLALILADIQRRQPLLLESLLGIEGDRMNSLLAKAVLIGIVAAVIVPAPVSAS
jgi:hypothetical protein